MATFTKSEFNALPQAVQTTLKADPSTVIVDDATVEVNPTAGGNVGALFADGDLLADEIPEEEEENNDSKLWVNIYVTFGGRRFRLTASSLDSDFVKYTDKDHTNENQVRNAIVNTVEKHGLAKAQEGIQFEIELTKQGESALAGDVDLLG